MRPTSRRVLCVDDDDPTSDLLELLFAHMGHPATTAPGPHEALTLIAREAFDLYVLETRFPKGSGVALCRALWRRTPSVPVVFYAGATKAEAQAAGRCAGASAYVPKPHIEKLIKVVRRLLAGRAAAAPPPKEAS